ncbi:MAG: glycosyltransferase family 39 protein, partial [Ottowia sp.]|nr:glycosyltransferase family 39 protein [Ottowia sp.]
MTSPKHMHTILSRGRGILKVCLVFVIAILVQVIAWEPDLNPYDEGIILTGADAIYRGRLPYRDFWTMYAPGQFYLLALLFHIFEPQEYLARCVGIVFRATAVALAWHMMQRFASKTLAALGASVLLFVLIYLHFEASPVFPATVFALLALLLVEHGMARRHSAAMLGAGICTAVATCFRQDIGLYAAVALIAGAGILRRTLWPAYTWRDAAKIMSSYTAGILILGVPIAAFFLWNVPLHDLHENLVNIPLHIYPDFRRLPWPGMEQA